MRRSEPPSLATWLLTRFPLGPKSESMIGDLIEQHRHGRSSAWYWWQTIRAIWTSVTNEVWEHKALALLAVAFGTYMDEIYMMVVRPSWLARFDAWYPILMNWLLEAEWDGVTHWAYRLQLYVLTGRITFCVFLAAVVWVMIRWRPQQRGLLVTLFVVTQVGLCLPYLTTALTDVLREPANPIWISNALAFSLFMFVAIPMSISCGARLAMLVDKR